jgi:transcription-repair coupling factor (superfamily II helicase)
MEHAYGGLPASAENLLNRARAKLLAGELGITSIGITRNKLSIEGLELIPEESDRLKAQGATYMVKSRKLLFPIANKETALTTLQELLLSLSSDEDATEEY